MSTRAANCPSCGGEIVFANAASVMVVCVHCGTASVRRDADLEKMGRVAEVAPIESALSLGATGKWRDRRWTAIGQVQLDHGKGPWNEWSLSFDDGGVGWLAEAQGEVLVTVPRPDLDAPLDQALGPGSRVSLDGRMFVVAEAGEARVVALRGELPEELAEGETYDYFDLRGPDDAFATVAVHSDGTAETYVGWAIPLHAAGVEASSGTQPAERRVASDRVACPSCGAPIQVRDPKGSMRVVCSSCGTMTDPRERKLRVIDKAKRLAERPAIPIGSRGRLREQDFEVLAFLVRSVRSEGVRYPWEEYLLRRRDGAYRWLVCTDGHWTLTEPANLGDVVAKTSTARWKGETFRHFQGGQAIVDHVQGEVYWEVAIGEKVKTDDYVAPPRILSFETSEGEVVVSVGTYVPVAEMAAAFPGVPSWSSTHGVAPNQPNPWAAMTRRAWRIGGLLAAAVLLVMIVACASAADLVVAKVHGTAPAAPTAGTPAATKLESTVAFSDEFQLAAKRGNVEISLRADVSNTWLGLDGALVELDTGDVYEFVLGVEWWSGVEDGEGWTEGSRVATAYLGGIPAGRYALRLDAETQSPTAIPYDVVVKSQVPSKGRGILALVLVLAPAMVVALGSTMFERRRWSTSDHAGGE